MQTIIERVKKWDKEHLSINLTETQRIAINGRILEGARWICKNKFDNSICFSVMKPYRNCYDSTVFCFNGDYSISFNSNLYKFVTFDNSPIYLPDLFKKVEKDEVIVSEN